MNVHCSTLWRTIGIVVLTFSVPAWAAESPMEVIRTTIEKATAVLQNPEYRGKEHFQIRLTKFRAVVEPQFDIQEISKRTLGSYWQERTEEERQQFMSLFTELVQKTY